MAASTASMCRTRASFLTNSRTMARASSRVILVPHLFSTPRGQDRGRDGREGVPSGCAFTPSHSILFRHTQGAPALGGLPPGGARRGVETEGVRAGALKWVDGEGRSGPITRSPLSWRGKVVLRKLLPETPETRAAPRNFGRGHCRWSDRRRRRWPQSPAPRKGPGLEAGGNAARRVGRSAHRGFPWPAGKTRTSARPPDRGRWLAEALPVLLRGRPSPQAHRSRRGLSPSSADARPFRQETAQPPFLPGRPGRSSACRPAEVLRRRRWRPGSTALLLGR